GATTRRGNGAAADRTGRASSRGTAGAAASRGTTTATARRTATAARCWRRWRRRAADGGVIGRVPGRRVGGVGVRLDEPPSLDRACTEANGVADAGVRPDRAAGAGLPVGPVAVLAVRKVLAAPARRDTVDAAQQVRA